MTSILKHHKRVSAAPNDFVELHHAALATRLCSLTGSGIFIEASSSAGCCCAHTSLVTGWSMSPALPPSGAIDTPRSRCSRTDENKRVSDDLQGRASSILYELYRGLLNRDPVHLFLRFHDDRY